MTGSTTWAFPGKSGHRRWDRHGRPREKVALERSRPRWTKPEIACVDSSLRAFFSSRALGLDIFVSRAEAVRSRSPRAIRPASVTPRGMAAYVCLVAHAATGNGAAAPGSASEAPQPLDLGQRAAGDRRRRPNDLGAHAQVGPSTARSRNSTRRRRSCRVRSRSSTRRRSSKRPRSRISRTSSPPSAGAPQPPR